MKDLTLPTPALLPCPFCGGELVPNTNLADTHVARYGTHHNHPPGTCFMADWEVTPSLVADWNTRAALSSNHEDGGRAATDEELIAAATRAGLHDEIWFGKFTPEGYEDCLPKLRAFASAIGKQERLPAEMERVLVDNLPSLYAKSEPGVALGGEKGEAVAWRDPNCPRHVISDADKRDFTNPTINSAVIAWKVQNCTQPLVVAPVAKVRMLTPQEALSAWPRYEIPMDQWAVALCEGIARKFCEVNGIALQDVQRGSKTPQKDEHQGT